MDALIQWAKDNIEIVALIVFLLGGGAGWWGALKKLAAATPTNIDDMAIKALEELLGARRDTLHTVTAEALEKRLTDKQIVEVVRLRKARWAARQEQQRTAGTG